MLVEHGSKLVVVEIHDRRPAGPAADEVQPGIDATEAIHDRGRRRPRLLRMNELADSGDPAIVRQSGLRRDGRQAFERPTDQAEACPVGGKGRDDGPPGRTGRPGDQDDERIGRGDCHAGSIARAPSSVHAEAWTPRLAYSRA